MRSPLMRARLVLVALAACLLTVAGCSGSGNDASTPDDGPEAGDSAPAEPPEQPMAVLRSDAETTEIVDAPDPAGRSVATSQALFEQAPVVVVSAGDSVDGAVESARELTAPVLVVTGEDDAAVLAEIDRLGAETILTVEAAAETWAQDADGLDAEIVTDAAELPELGQPEPTAGLAVLTTDPEADVAALGTARAAGADVVVVPGGDPRAAPDAIEALAAATPERVLALGTEFGEPATLAERVQVATTGAQLPGGGQVVFPGRTMVALYGHPGTASLGELGAQDVEASVARAKELAAEYEDLVDEPVVPTFEIITTIASSEPGADGSYSSRASIDLIRPWVDAAAEAGVYVVLDLQPGRTDFLTQAQAYEELLLEPHVGLALDPEWRLEEGQRHLAQIGSVTAAEVNTVVDWLAELTRENALPQKVLVLHQFRHSMITDRDQVDTSHDELAVLVHADGNGTPGQKMETYNSLTAGDTETFWWGWKNFYDEDDPTFTPEQTIAVQPQPVFISYQ